MKAIEQSSSIAEYYTDRQGITSFRFEKHKKITLTDHTIGDENNMILTELHEVVNPIETIKEENSSIRKSLEEEFFNLETILEIFQQLCILLTKIDEVKKEYVQTVTENNNADNNQEQITDKGTSNRDHNQHVIEDRPRIIGTIPYKS